MIIPPDKSSYIIFWHALMTEVNKLNTYDYLSARLTIVTYQLEAALKYIPNMDVTAINNCCQYCLNCNVLTISLSVSGFQVKSLDVNY